MASTFTGKVALVTGSAQGLGRAFAELLLDRGAKVSLVDRNKATGQETENQWRTRYGENRTLFVQCDVSNKSQLEAAFSVTTQKFGGLDIVVNNAGIEGEDNWEKIIAINLNAVIHGSKLAIEAMRKDGGGRGGLIVNISSFAGLTAPPLISAYCASKHGVIGFTRSFAATYAVETHGVRICCLCPSFTDTELMEKFTAVNDAAPDTLRKAAQKLEQIVQRTGCMQPCDVTAAFLRLVLDERAHGAVLQVTPAGQAYRFPRHLVGKL